MDYTQLFRPVECTAGVSLVGATRTPSEFYSEEKGLALGPGFNTTRLKCPLHAVGDSALKSYFNSITDSRERGNQNALISCIRRVREAEGIATRARNWNLQATGYIKLLKSKSSSN